MGWMTPAADLAARMLPRTKKKAKTKRAAKRKKGK
jgi:hypothetical protein